MLLQGHPRVFSILSKPNFLSLSSEERCFVPLIIFVATSGHASTILWTSCDVGPELDAVFQVVSHQSGLEGRQGARNLSYTGKGFISRKTEFILKWEQTPQTHGRVTKDFQDVTGHGAKLSHLGSFSHRRLDQLGGLSHAGLFYESKLFYELKNCLYQLHVYFNRQIPTNSFPEKDFKNSSHGINI